MRERSDQSVTSGQRPAPQPLAPGVWRRSSYEVRAEAVAEVREAVRAYVEHVRNHEPDTWWYAVIQTQGNAAEFVHFAAFKNQSALSASQSSAAYQTFVEILRPALSGDVRVETTEGFPVAEGGSRLISRTDVSVQVRLIVRKRSDLPRFQRLVVAFTHRREDGLLSSDAFRDPKNDRVFFIYERWSSQEALDAAMGSKLQMELLALAALTNEDPFSIT